MTIESYVCLYAWRLIVIGNCDYIQTQVFWKSVFEVFCQTPKRGWFCLYCYGRTSTKKLSASGGFDSWPLNAGCVPGSRWGFAPDPRYRLAFPRFVVTSLWINHTLLPLSPYSFDWVADRL